MNQILQSQNNYNNNYFDYYNNQQNNQYNGQNQQYYNSNSRLDQKTVKIIRFFAVFMILFAFVLIGKSGYYFYQKQHSIHDNPVVSYKRKANELEVIVNSEHPIKQLEYVWQIEQPVIIMGNGNNEFKQKISIPTGNNLLKITVTDYYGYTKSFHSQFQNLSDGNDQEKPTVEYQSANKKIIATVKDNVELKYFTYKWNDNETKIVYPEGENKAEITVEIDIDSSGELTIIAEDINNNRFEETKKVTGSMKPEITINVDSSANSLNVHIKDINGLKKITVQVDETLEDSGDEPINKKEIDLKVPLSLGKHTIVITAENLDGRTETVEKNVEM